MENNIYDQLCEAAGEECVKLNENMSSHTTFRIGGAAEYFVAPRTTEGVEGTLKLCREQQIPFYVIGNGSNILVSDEGVSGVILQIGNGLSDMNFQEGRLVVQAGTMLTKAANLAARQGYTGMEFAVGIPGTVGGAIAMNAGAYGGEIKDVIVSATVLTKEGKLLTLTRGELELGYRSSRIAREQYVVLEAEFCLEPGNAEEIKAACEKNMKARMEKQPLEYPSAGSTFKRPKGYFAGKLIMDAGLRGFQVGDAQVSEKHCGFLINRGKATAEDMQKLIQQVQTRVQETYGVTLEPEVKMIGF
ncbi:MAG: UDP-N-acetylmuramate dehydrogenase [Lachnospiraceae bacterium]|nr:UDP-N-acetylmuramate dehydrogenase [Lachnospiraceae bacterium]